MCLFMYHAWAVAKRRGRYASKKLVTPLETAESPFAGESVGLFCKIKTLNLY